MTLLVSDLVFDTTAQSNTFESKLHQGFLDRLDSQAGLVALHALQKRNEDSMVQD